jgi:hypothetical protein
LNPCGAISPASADKDVTLARWQQSARTDTVCLF